MLSLVWIIFYITILICLPIIFWLFYQRETLNMELEDNPKGFRFFIFRKKKKLKEAQS